MLLGFLDGDGDGEDDDMWDALGGACVHYVSFELDKVLREWGVSS